MPLSLTFLLKSLPFFHWKMCLAQDQSSWRLAKARSWECLPHSHGVFAFLTHHISSRCTQIITYHRFTGHLSGKALVLHPAILNSNSHFNIYLCSYSLFHLSFSLKSWPYVVWPNISKQLSLLQVSLIASHRRSCTFLHHKNGEWEDAPHAPEKDSNRSMALFILKHGKQRKGKS